MHLGGGRATHREATGKGYGKKRKIKKGGQKPAYHVWYEEAEGHWSSPQTIEDIKQGNDCGKEPRD